MNIFSPHYNYGRSIFKFSLNKLAISLTFFYRRGLSRETKKKLRKLKNSKFGKTALVLGNGPSLKILEPKNLDKYVDDVFVCNDFYSLEVAKFVTPTYYCLSDPYYFVNNSTRFDRNVQLIKYVSTSNSIFLISNFYRRQLKAVSNPTLLFDDREWFFFNRGISPLKPRSYSSVTIYKALAFACFLGYSKIFILGIDNTEIRNYRSNDKNQIYLDVDSNYASKSSNNSDVSQRLLQFPGDMAGRFHSYANLFQDLFLFRKFPIFNLDCESLITSFDKLPRHPLIKEQYWR